MGADEEEDSISAEREVISACNTVVSRTLRRLSSNSISRVAAATVSSVIAVWSEGVGAVEETFGDVANSTSDNCRAAGATADVSSLGAELAKFCTSGSGDSIAGENCTP